MFSLKDHGHPHTYSMTHPCCYSLMWDRIYILHSSVSHYHLSLLCTSCHETPAAVWPSCLCILLGIFLLDCSLSWGWRHCETHCELHEKCIMFEHCFFEVYPVSWAWKRQSLSSIYKEALCCFIPRTCFIPKFQCGFSASWITGPWIGRMGTGCVTGLMTCCHEENVSEDTNVWHVGLILSNGFWWDWNHPETKVCTSILRREEIRKKSNLSSSSCAEEKSQMRALEIIRPQVLFHFYCIREKLFSNMVKLLWSIIY